MIRRALTEMPSTLSLRLFVALAVLTSATIASAQASSAGSDPRVGLPGGHWVDAAEAISNLDLIAHKDRPAGYFNPANRGDFALINRDMAFRDHFLFQGNGRGVMIWDIRTRRTQRCGPGRCVPMGKETYPSTATCCSCRPNS